MSALAQGPSTPTCKFQQLGDSHKGRIVHFEDTPERKYQSTEPKTWPNGDIIYGVRVLIEKTPGDEETRHNLFIVGKDLKTKTREALAEVGRDDLQVGDDIAVTWSAVNGMEHIHTVTYAAN